MHKLWRYAFVVLLIGAISAGWVQLASSDDVKPLGALLTNAQFGSTSVQQIALCPNNNNEGWLVSVGPGNRDYLFLTKITGFNSGSLKAAGQIQIGSDAEAFGRDDGLPAGVGPRGFAGVALDFNCQNAYIPNFFLDSVIKVNLKDGLAEKSLVAPSKSIPWPAGFNNAAAGTIDTPIAAAINGLAGTRVYVSSAPGSVVVLNAANGKVVDTLTSNGTGLGTVIAAGDAWVAALQNSGGLGCIDMVSKKVTGIGGLGINPFMAVATGDLSTIYVSNQGSNTVSVVSGGGCNKKVTKTISVGNAPRFLALSPDGKFLYVSNATDNTVSVISTASRSVVTTIDVAPNDPAPVGPVAVSGNNTYMYVFYEGGVRSAAGVFQVFGYDVRGLY